MTVPADTLATFRADLAGISQIDDPRHLEARSKDFYWYSPILSELLDGRTGQVLLQPRHEAEVIRIAAAAARHRIPLTVRGGGTGNYGQCVPLEGGAILDVTRLDRILDIQPGRVLCEAGARIGRMEEAVVATGQMLTMFPSTKRLATIGGFIAGGSGGIGSLRHGMLRDGGNLGWLRVVTVEETPRVLELRGPDIQKVQHAYGTNGIITALDYGLVPLVDWHHSIALFKGYGTALAFAQAAQAEAVDAYLMTVVEGRFARFYRGLGDRFPEGRDAVFAMIAPAARKDFADRVARAGGTVSLDMTLHEVEAARLPPAWECGWNHTTLQALKHEPGRWTYLQVAYPRPFDPALVARQIARYGDEIYFHHEMARQGGEVQTFAIPLVRWTSRDRLYAVIRELETQDGCTVFDPHVVTIEDGGMKEIDHDQIAFKRQADPYGLLNPGKTRGWMADVALQGATPAPAR